MLSGAYGNLSKTGSTGRQVVSKEVQLLSVMSRQSILFANGSLAWSARVNLTRTATFLE